MACLLISFGLSRLHDKNAGLLAHIGNRASADCLLILIGATQLRDKVQLFWHILGTGLRLIACSSCSVPPICAITMQVFWHILATGLRWIACSSCTTPLACRQPANEHKNYLQASTGPLLGLYRASTRARRIPWLVPYL